MVLKLMSNFFVIFFTMEAKSSSEVSAFFTLCLPMAFTLFDAGSNVNFVIKHDKPVFENASFRQFSCLRLTIYSKIRCQYLQSGFPTTS